MIESYDIVAFWGPRRESALECGTRAEQWMKGLACIDGLFGFWAYGGGPRPTSKHKVKPIAKELEDLLIKDKERGEQRYGRVAGREGSYLIGMWNGGVEDESSIGLDLRCGTHEDDTSETANACSLSVHVRNEYVIDRLLSSEVLMQIFACTMNAWDPGIIRAEVTNVEWPANVRMYIHFAFYVCIPQSELPVLPPPSYSLPLKGGSVVFATNERFSLENKEHVEAAIRLSGIFPDAEVYRKEISSVPVDFKN